MSNQFEYNKRAESGEFERERIEELEKEVKQLRLRLLTAAGDDLCRLSQEEIKAIKAGRVQIPPKEEFLASCEQFHAQMTKEVGVFEGCLTLAQLIAENEKLRSQLPEGMKHCTILCKQCEKGHAWLTATNWVQHGCPTCERGELKNKIEWLNRQLKIVEPRRPDDGYSGL